MDPMQAAHTGPGEQAHKAERHHERSAIFATAAGHPRHMLDSVRRRLILVLALALMPIAALCFAQGIMQINMQTREAQQELVRGAHDAAARVEQMFAQTEQALKRLSEMEEIRAGSPSCAALLRGAAAALPFAANITLRDARGEPVCSTQPASGTFPLPNSQPLHAGTGGRTVDHAPGLQLTLQHGKNKQDDPRIIAALPLQSSAQAGQALAMAIPLGGLGSLMQGSTPPESAITALFTPHGQQLASSAPAESAHLFVNLPPPLQSEDQGPLELRDSKNAAWISILAPIGRDGLRVAFAMPENSLFRWSALTLAAGFALPTLIVTFSLLALWLAVDSIVLRWLLYLRRVTAVYAQGHYRFRPNRLKGAPSEFRVLGQAVEDMASAVRLRDARLRTSLAEKTALVREIHHRIKNSLQIVVSLLSLYGARLDKGEDRQRFEQLRLRVNTLALVHRILYEVAEGSQVHLDELLRELAGLLERAGEQPLRVRVEAQDAPLSTDMAVPLALMVAEVILSLSLQRTGSSSPLFITLGGAANEGQLHLHIRTPLADGHSVAALSDLAHGFASQLGGRLDLQQEGLEQVVRGEFPCPVAGIDQP